MEDCAACGAGTFSATVGQSECIDCDSGKFSATVGQSECIDCDSGKFSATVGQSECINCTPVQHSNGDVLCTDLTDSQVLACSDGYHLVEDVADSCPANVCSQRTTAVAGYATLPVCEGRTTGSIACSQLPLCDASTRVGAPTFVDVTCDTDSKELNVAGCCAALPPVDGMIIMAGMAAVAAFAGTPTFDRGYYDIVVATTGGAGALTVCLAASAAAAVGTAPDSRTSPTVGIGARHSTAAISLSIDCAATSELCRVRRLAPRTQPFLRRWRSSAHRPV
jgi:hypothetical protein